VNLVSVSDDTVSTFDAVAAQLRSWPSLGLPDAEELVSAPPPSALEPVSSVDSRLTDHVAAERAFGTTAAIAELLAELEREASRELARGGIALPDSKRLAAAMSVSLEQVPELHNIAARAGLIAIDNAQWLPTPEAASWTVESSGERWARLAGAWLDKLPPDIRHVLAVRSHSVWGERLEEFVGWLFPAGGDWMRDRIRVYTRDAERLGISAHHTPSRPGAILLMSGPAKAAEAMAALFPPEVHKVYLQHDLSIVSPGPLLPPLDARLRTMADVESRALASTYRVSSSSLNRAMTLGESAHSIREFLTSISLTGIPQPLAYLLAETEARYGLLRVGSIEGDSESGARSYIRSDDRSLLGTLVVDQSLSPLGLLRTSEQRVVSRFGRDIVFWSLSEAKYPVAAENERHEVIVLQRKNAARNTPPSARNASLALIERLRLGSSDSEETTGRAWLTRQLDHAIRSKVPLAVTVTMPDGTAVEYHLEPTSVAGGRLRARDRGSEIERTLPLSSITAIIPIEQ
jgi:hypothetical protein